MGPGLHDHSTFVTSPCEITLKHVRIYINSVKKCSDFRKIRGADKARNANFCQQLSFVIQYNSVSPTGLTGLVVG